MSLRTKTSSSVPSVASGDSATTIENLVEAIRKHKKFKQLASYNIQCLEKPLSKTHNRYGWEAAARTAFELGAAQEVAESCARFATDGEYFRMCMQCLISMSNVPKCLPAIMANADTPSHIVNAVRTYVDSIDVTSSSLAESIGVVTPAFALLSDMSRQDTAVFHAAGGIDMLADIAASDKRPKFGTTATAKANYESYAAFVAGAVGVIDKSSRAKAGLEALMNKRTVTKLLKVSVLNLLPPSDAGKTAARSTPRKDAGGGGALRADVNAHLGPSFRLLDRVARTDMGRELLLSCGATSALSPIMGTVLRMPSVAPLAMRVLARLLGSNIAGLVDRIAGETVPPVDIAERMLCARLLDFMLKDDECVNVLVSEDGALLRRLGKLVDAAPLAGTDGAAAIISVFRKLADYSTDNISLLEDCGTIQLILGVLHKSPTNVDVVAECVGFLASMIDCHEMVDLLSNVAGKSTWETCVRVAAAFSTHAQVAMAVLSLIEKALFFDGDASVFVKGGAITLVLSALKSLANDVDLQLHGTDVLIYLATSGEHVDLMMAEGVVDVVIRNLGMQQVADSNENAVAGDDDEEFTGQTQGVDKQLKALSAQLVASSLYLTTSICAVDKHINPAKAAGIIRAVLTGFSRHIHDQNVYKNFREVITALRIEESEVIHAIKSVAAWSVLLQESYTDSDVFKQVEDFVHRITADGCELFSGKPTVPSSDILRNSKGEVDMNAAAEHLLEHISLLEAVTVSPVFVCVISVYDGVPALLHVLGTVSVLKMLAREQRAKGQPRALQSISLQQQGISANLMDDVLARTCNTLAHLARVAYELAGGQVEQDEAYEPIDFAEFDIEGQLYDKERLALVSRAVSAAAKPQLRQFGLASVTLLSWLASGHGETEAREHADALIAVQGVEAIVSMLRAHQGVVEICSAIAGGLTRIAITPRGATAVATRGGSRQVVRTLHATAALRTNPGDELLLAYLRMLDTIAVAGSEPADILRRQGTVEAVVACIDAGTTTDFTVDADANRSKTAKGAESSYVPDQQTRKDIDATIASLLSRLTTKDLVSETVRFLNNVISNLEAKVFAPGYDGKSPLSVPDCESGAIIGAIVRLGLLSTTAAGKDAGEDVLKAGALACAQISRLGLRVGKVCSENGTLAPMSLESELDLSTPCSFRTARLLASALSELHTETSEASLKQVGAVIFPILFQALEEKPEIAAELMSTASLLSSQSGSATAIVKEHGGKGLDVFVNVLRHGAERGEEPLVRDALLTIAGIAATPGQAAAVVSSGAVHVAFSYLADNINDASADTLSAAFLVLARCAADPSVLSEIVQDNHIFDLAKTALRRFGQDPYNPQEPLVHAVAEVMTKLAAASKVSNAAAHSEEFKNTLKRLIRAAACSTGYIDSSRCSTAILNLIATACAETATNTRLVAEANRDVVISSGGEDLVVQCMSSYAATQEVLAAGYAAMQALGSQGKTAQVLEQIDSYAVTIPQWLDQGYTVSEPQVMEMTVAMADLLKNLASQIVVSDGQILDLGSSYADILATVWRAVAVVCREDVTTVRGGVAGITGSKELHQAKADTLSVTAQIIGRLNAAANVAKRLGNNEENYKLAEGDMVSVLYTILAAAHGVLEVRVVESLCKSVEHLVDDLGIQGLHSMCTSKVMAGFMSLLQVVHSELARARIAAAGGSMVSTAESTLPVVELHKCEAAVNNAVKHIASMFRAQLSSNARAASLSGLLSDADALADIMNALALTTASFNVATTSKDDQDAEESSSAPAQPANPDAASSDLNLLSDALVSAAKGSAHTAAVWSLLRHTAGAISQAMQGAAKHGAQGHAPLYAVSSLQSTARVFSSVLKAVTTQLCSTAQLPAVPQSVGSASQMETLIACLNAGLDVAFDGGRHGRNKAAGRADSSESKPEYTGTETEAAAVRAAFSVTTAVCTTACKSVFELLARTDFSSKVSCDEVISGADFVAPYLFCLGSKEFLGAPGLGVALIQSLCNFSDLYSEDMMKRSPTSTPNRTARVTLLADRGVYKHVAQSLTYNTVVDLDYTEIAIQLLSGVAQVPGIPSDPSALGLDKSSLLAVNATLKRFADVPELTASAAAVVTKLEAAYQEQSGAAFENIIKRALVIAAGASPFSRRLDASGNFIFETKPGGPTTSVCPKLFHDFLDSLLSVDMVARSLDEDAVTPVTVETISGLIQSINAHSHDFGIVGIALNALGKLAANPDNHGALVSSGIVQLACKKFAQHGFLEDPRICEGVAATILPLSFEQHYVKTVLTEADVIPLLIGVIKKYVKHLSTYAGSPANWLLDSQKDHNSLVAAMKSDATDAEERNKLLPRLAQMCVQSLANLACDNEASTGGVSSVDRIVACGGIEALGELMSYHTDNPRLLEDSICALSNMAFVSDKIQLAVGQSCMDTVCASATNFNADSYLFQMTLRAIGNLTRVDENIMRAVGYGVIKGMVEGMIKHADDPSVLQLCADVIGNMASVDDKKVGRETGIRILTDCSGKRKTTAATTAVSAPAAPLTPLPPSVPKMPKGASQPKALTTEALIAVVERAKSLKEAVCTVLYEDGAPKALVTAMTKHYRNADLAGSCLRALHYIGASAELVTRMVDELALVDQVVFIMRSIDYRPDVLRRGARVLGLVVGTENLKDKVLAAGAPSMLLQAIETHRTERELCISCYSVLAMARSGAVVAAVQEMQAVDTAVAILRQHAGDHEFAGVLLELLWGWAAEADLAASIATKASPTLMSLLQTYASDKDLPERPQQLSYILNLVIALVRQRVDANVLITAGLVPGLQAVCKDILDGTDGGIMLSQRMLVMQSVTIFMEIAKPQAKEASAVVSKEGVAALLQTPAGLLLEKILTVYKAVPDPRVPGQLLYDQSMCERAHGVLQDLIGQGYTPAQPVVLDAPEDEGPISEAALASLPPAVRAELDALLGPGKTLECWVEGKVRKVRLDLSADKRIFTLHFDDGKGKAEFGADKVKGVLLNVPAGAKKKGGLFTGRQPRADRAITILDAAGMTIFHLEVDREQIRDCLASVFAALAGVDAKA